MKKAINSFLILLLAALLSGCAPGTSITRNERDVIMLPEVTMSFNMPLSQTLKNRKSTNNFDENKILNFSTISDLLWSANGINRPNGKRTAHHTLGRNAIDLYVEIPEGIYLYNAKKNELIPTAKHVHSCFIHKVPFSIIYVADLSKQSKEYAYLDAGFISQNVFLYAASNNLNTILEANNNKEDLIEALNLSNSKEILFIQHVGYPKK